MAKVQKSSGNLPEQVFYHSTEDKHGKPVTFACAFTYDRDNHVLRYAGSAFRPDEGSKSDHPSKDQKEGIRYTASQRLKVCPVVIHDFANPEHVYDFREYLRTELEKFKLKGKRVKE